VSNLDELRFPIGRYSEQAYPTPSDRAAHLEALRMLPECLGAGASGLNQSQLETPYRDGGWTVRQVVHHVADSHANAYIRCKLALTEDWPTIKPYDEAAWASLADARLLGIDISLTLIAALHLRWVALFESIAGEDFEKGYRHPERGPQTLAQALALYAWHSRHHTAHIAALRARHGW
jgi:hypothetical protein